MNIPIDKMSVSEKLEAFSFIWDRLGETPDAIPTPGWQQDELQRRSERLDSGESNVSDWDEAEVRFDRL